MGTNNKTISQLNKFDSTAGLNGKDLFIMSRNLATIPDTQEYVSYKLQYDTLTASLFKDLSGTIRNDISNAILHGDLASCDYLADGYWSGESIVKGLVPLTAVLNANRYATYHSIDLATACTGSDPKFTNKLPIDYVSHPFKRIATYNGLDLSKANTDDYPLSGLLPKDKINYDFKRLIDFNGLDLSKANTDDYPLSGHLHVNNIVGLLNLATKSFISLSTDLNDGTLTSNGVLKDSLPSSRVDGLCALAAMEYVHLNDRAHVKIPSNALALSTKQDLNLGNLATEYKWKYYQDLGLNTIASANIPIAITNTAYLTGQIPVARIDGLAEYINNPSSGGYALPTASTGKLGGIKIGSNETDSMTDRRDFKLSVNSDSTGIVRINHAKASSNGEGGAAGLMSAQDKEKLDKAITEKYTLVEASTTTLGGIKLGTDDSVTGSNYNVNMFPTSKVAYVHVNNAVPSSNKVGGKAGLLTAIDKEKLDNALTSLYSLNVASKTVLGGVKTGTSDANEGNDYNIDINNGDIAFVHINNVISRVSANAKAGLMTPEDKEKLDNALTSLYSLNVASKTKLGGVKTGTSDETEGNNYNLDINSNDVAYVHVNNAVPSSNKVGGKAGLLTAIDKEKLDNALTSLYSLTPATNYTLGGIKIGYSGTTYRTYPVLLDTSNKAYVNVPWTDTNTTYTAGDGIDITNNVIKVVKKTESQVKYSSTLIGPFTQNYSSTGDTPTTFFTAADDCILTITINCKANSCGTKTNRKFAIIYAGQTSWTTLTTMSWQTPTTFTVTMMLKSGDRLGVTGYCGSGHGTVVTYTGTYLTRS